MNYSFRKLVLLQTLILIVVIGLIGVFSHFYFYKQYIGSVEKNIRDQLEVVKSDVPLKYGTEWCRRISFNINARVSVIHRIEGNLLCDSNPEPVILKTYIDRPEIQNALESPDHFGKSIRFSRTLKDSSFYGALVVPERNVVLRIGIRLAEINRSITTFDHVIETVIFVLALLLAFLTLGTGRFLVFPFISRLIRTKTEQIHSDFLAHMSHELRTPLTSIKGFADTLLKDIETGRVIEKEFVKIISEDSSRLLNLVNELLDLSQLEHGAIKITSMRTDTREVTQDALSRLNIIYASKNHTVTTSYEATEVYGDPDRILQILLNLIGNSFKYSNEATGIRIHWVKTADGGVLVKIKDEGPGIRAQDQKRIFEPFFRSSDLVSQRSIKGAGLGLSIARQLVLLHGGTISFQSLENQGTEFSITFPPSPEVKI